MMNATADTEITHNEIALLAESIWQNEGCPEGKALEHWLRAEAHLRDERTVKVAKKLRKQETETVLVEKPVRKKKKVS